MPHKIGEYLHISQHSIEMTESDLVISNSRLFEHELYGKEGSQYGRIINLIYLYCLFDASSIQYKSIKLCALTDTTSSTHQLGKNGN